MEKLKIAHKPVFWKNHFYGAMLFGLRNIIHSVLKLNKLELNFPLIMFGLPQNLSKCIFCMANPNRKLSFYAEK